MKALDIVRLIASILVTSWFAMWVTQAIKREQWRSSVKLTLSVIVSAAAALSLAFLNGSVLHLVRAWPNISYTEVLTFGTFIFATAQAWYKHYYKGDEWMATLAAFPAKKATK